MTSALVDSPGGSGIVRSRPTNGGRQTMRIRATKSIAATVVILMLCFARPTPAPASPNTPSCPQGLTSSIPPRAPGALTGSAFVERVAHINDSEREAIIGNELMQGNLPSFLRHLKPVTLQGQTPAGEIVHITICVAPDYLAIGSDSDFIRIPIGLETRLTGTELYGA